MQARGVSHCFYFQGWRKDSPGQACFSSQSVARAAARYLSLRHAEGRMVAPHVQWPHRRERGSLKAPCAAMASSAMLLGIYGLALLRQCLLAVTIGGST